MDNGQIISFKTQNNEMKIVTRGTNVTVRLTAGLMAEIFNASALP